MNNPVANYKKLPHSPIYYAFWGFVFYICSAGLFFLCQSGSDFAGILSAVFFILSYFNMLRFVRAVAETLYEEAVEKLVSEASATEGNAKWATFDELKAAKMVLAEGDGYWLGPFIKNGPGVFYPGESHLLTIAPPGSGKTTDIVIPTLLGQGKRSIIVTDPKGELYAITGAYRRDKFKQNVIVLCPWAEQLSKELGIEIPDHGFNPLSILDPASDNIRDDCELIASLLYPKPAKVSSDQDFWIDGGQQILTAFILHIASDIEKYGPLTLPRLRQYLHLRPEEMTGLLSEMSENTAFGGCI